MGGEYSNKPRRVDMVRFIVNHNQLDSIAIGIHGGRGISLQATESRGVESINNNNNNNSNNNNSNSNSNNNEDEERN
jgi:hypothetical protein